MSFNQIYNRERTSPDMSHYGSMGSTFNLGGHMSAEMHQRENSGAFLASDSIHKYNSTDINPSLGFNSTTQRFSYMKELNKKEDPGPGSYNEDTSTIAATMKANTKKALLNTISSTGGKSGVSFTAIDSTLKNHQKIQSNFTIGSKMFMD